MEDYAVYLLLIIIVICIVCQPHIEMKIMKKINLYDVLLYKTILYIIVIITFYSLFINTNIFCNIDNLLCNRKECYLIALSTLLSVIITFGFLYIIKNEYNLTRLIPKMECGIVILSFFIGYFYYNEKINSKQLLGISLIIVGIFLTSKKQ
tara:strand:- start:996 stop:1448 length:453 start_codon:yes stop_codon:yes gene_type:complete